MVLRGLGRRTLYRCNQADEDVYVYYFGDSPKEGAMETGTCTLEIDGEDYYYKFISSGSKKGAGVNEIDDDCIYIQGRRVEAEDGSKYEPYEYDGKVYLISTSGKIMKNKTNIKDADDTYYCTLPITCTQSSRGDFLSPLTPPYMPFGIRRFNITSKHDAHYNSQDSL